MKSKDEQALENADKFFGGDWRGDNNPDMDLILKMIMDNEGENEFERLRIYSWGVNHMSILTNEFGKGMLECINFDNLLEIAPEQYNKAIMLGAFRGSLDEKTEKLIIKAYKKDLPKLFTSCSESDYLKEPELDFSLVC